ncbi:MAG: hypothetical protein HOO91_21315 [Bacteroidales bacterium]|nr:hypothetical protein [Bacteroidales bacterium]
MPLITAESIYNALKRKNYKVFEKDNNPYNLNIIGIRNDNRQPNSFDDWIVVMWKYEGNWSIIVNEVTTDPGLYWLQHPQNPSGTAILKEGQYSGSHKIGFHKNYKALQQVGDLTVLRDYNLDGTLDYGTTKEETGNYFGINIHRAVYNGRSITVDKWSAGCQVFANSFDFDQFMLLCAEAAKYWGDVFTYTLINVRDIK